MRKLAVLTALTSAVLASLLLAVPHGWAQREVTLLEPEDAQAELTRATRERERAEARAARLEAEAEAADEALDRTAREAAALAAQIQAAEARIAGARARYSLAQSDRQKLAKRLADRREPLVRLTGALQTTARRPLALSALQPGSLKDVVYVRAVLSAAVPEIRKRTAALRGELDERQRLERRASRALEEFRASETALQQRRTELTAVETRQRLALREARGNAARENERALALAEEALDLDGLVDRLGEDAELRRELAALPGPILRPSDLSVGVEERDVGAAQATAANVASTARPQGYQLPVQGRTLTGFGELRDSGLRSKGLTLAPTASAQVVAPSAGRVAFAGPYRGFGRIVIIEHPGGWTSLVTGMDRTEVEVGDEIITGAPLGIAGKGDQPITFELRRNGQPVNPLNFLG